MTTQNPTFAEVIDAAMEHRMRESFGGWLPGRVETYSATTNRASVQILVMDEYIDEDGERQTESFPVLLDVPVAWPSLGGKFTFRMTTLARGDECIVFFAARPVSKFLKTGGGPIDPEDDRHHDINDAFILPCKLSGNGSNANPMIEITSSDIRAGGSDKVMLHADGADFVAVLQAVSTTLASGGAAAASGKLAIDALISALQSMPILGVHAGQAWPVAASKLKGG